jgi:cytochrome b subunit of formate dehydrogenase
LLIEGFQLSNRMNCSAHVCFGLPFLLTGFYFFWNFGFKWLGSSNQQNLCQVSKFVHGIHTSLI